MRKLIVLAVAILTAAVVLGQSTTKDLVGVEDLRYGVGTWSRTWSGNSYTMNEISPVNVLSLGVDNTGATDCSDSLQVLLNLGGDVYLPKGDYTVSGSISVPDSTRMIISDGSVLTGTCTLTVSGVISAGPYQVFGSGVTVVPDGDIYMSSEWWAAADSVLNVAERADNATVVYPSGQVDLYGASPSFGMKRLDGSKNKWAMSVDGTDNMKITRTDTLGTTQTGFSISGDDVPVYRMGGPSLQQHVVVRESVGSGEINADLGNVFSLEYISPVLYESIEGGQPWQEIMLFSRYGNVTLRQVGTGNIRLESAEDWSGEGAFIKLFKDIDGNWRETSRSEFTASTDAGDTEAPSIYTGTNPDGDPYIVGFLFSEDDTLKTRTTFTTSEQAISRVYWIRTSDSASDTSSWTTGYQINSGITLATAYLSAAEDGEEYTIFGQAEDQAGNRSSWAQLWQSTYDAPTPASTPTISSVVSAVGSFEEGASMTISGSNFGEGATIYAWDDFEGHPAGSRLSGLNPVIGEGLWENVQDGAHTSPSVESSVYARSGSNAVRVLYDGTGSLNTVDKVFSVDGVIARTDTLFTTFTMAYVDSGSASYPTSHRKVMLWSGAGLDGSVNPAWASTSSNWQVEFGVPGILGIGDSDYRTTVAYDTGFASTPADDLGSVIRWSMYVDHGTVATADGIVKVWKDADRVYYGNGIVTNASETDHYAASFGAMYESGSLDNAGVYLDDIYIANTEARVEIGDESVYANCTKIDIVPHLTWVNDSIVADIRFPGYAAGDSFYVFVTNENGLVSSGTKVNLTGDPTPTGTLEFSIVPYGITSSQGVRVATSSGASPASEIAAQWRLYGDSVWAPDSTQFIDGNYSTDPVLTINTEIPAITPLDTLEARAKLVTEAGQSSAWTTSGLLIYGQEEGDTEAPSLVNAVGGIDCNGGNIEINMWIEGSEPCTMTYQWKVGEGSDYVDGSDDASVALTSHEIIEQTATACSEGDTVFTLITLEDEASNGSGSLVGPTMIVPGAVTTPTISGVSGSTDDGGSMVISGSGFGVKGIPGPVVWDDVENSYDGWSVTPAENMYVPSRDPSNGDAAYFSDAPWEHNSTLVGNGHYVRFGLDSGRQRRDGNMYYRINRKGAFERDFYGPGDLYVDWWLNPHYSSADGYNSTSSKILRLWNSSGCRRNGYITWAYESTHFARDEDHDGVNDYGPGCDESPSGDNYYNSTGFRGYAKAQEWNHLAIEFDADADGDGGTGYGNAYLYVDGTKISIEDRIFVSDDVGRIRILGFDPSIPDDGTNWYMTDIYVDTTFARVEIGDNPVYNSCTHREVQVCDGWSSGLISLELEWGSFSAGDTCYVFVTDRNKTNSAGSQIVLGETITADTTAPVVESAVSDHYESLPFSGIVYLDTDEASQGFMQWKRWDTGSWAPSDTTGQWSPVAYTGTTYGIERATSYSPSESDTVIFRYMVRDVELNESAWAAADSIFYNPATTFHSEQWIFGNSSTLAPQTIGYYGHNVDTDTLSATIAIGGTSCADTVDTYYSNAGDLYRMEVNLQDTYLPLACGTSDIGRFPILYFQGFADSLAGKTVTDADLNIWPITDGENLTDAGSLVVAAITDTTFATWVNEWVSYDHPNVCYAWEDSLNTTAWTTNWSQISAFADIADTIAVNTTIATGEINSIDITSLVQAVAALDDPEDFGGFIIYGTTNPVGNGRFYFRSQGYSSAASRPSITVTTSEPD